MERVVAIVLVLGLASCEERSPACSQQRDCVICTTSGGCLWCFETGECLVESTFCPGDIARTADQCEAEEALAPDAGTSSSLENAP